MAFRGGRGGAIRGGRGRGAGDSAAARPSKVPSAFRVVRDDGDDDAPPVAVSARRSSRAGGDAEEEEHYHHPPQQQRGGRGAARGAGRGGFEGRGAGRGAGRGGFEGRGAGRGAGRGGRGGRGGFEGRGAGRGAGRGGFEGRGGGRGGRGGRGASSPVDSAPEQQRDDAPPHVITTVTGDGTELPARLNSKVFIDGLPYSYDEPGKPTLEDELMQFALAWKVGRPIRLIKKPGQGFGFLVFRSPNSVDTAVRVLNGRKFLGRALRVEAPKPRDLEEMKDIAGLRDVGKDSFMRQVLLTDLNKVAQPEIIREVLRDVAPQLEKKLETIKMTSQNRKAFLTFAAEADVDPAVTLLDGFQLLGRKIGAVKAAPPGSLSYSRSAHGGGRVLPPSAEPAAVGAADAAGDAAADDVAVVPLGLDAPAPRAAPRAAAAAAAAAAKGSNVTGKTSRYDLLDKGPREIYVGNLGDHVTAEQLREHLAPCGAITTCELLVNPGTHLSTGIARVEFALPAYAAYAKTKYHGSRLRGCVLRVDRGDEASAPLASETPAADDAEEYDEDRYMAERYGVRDRESFFKDTQFEDEEAAAAMQKKRKGAGGATATTGKRGRDADADADARGPAKKRKAAAAALERGVSGADIADDDDDDGIDLVFGGDMPYSGGRGGGDDDDDDEEERFFDVDTVPVEEEERPARRKKAAAGDKKKGAGAAAGGKKKAAAVKKVKKSK